MTSPTGMTWGISPHPFMQNVTMHAAVLMVMFSHLNTCTIRHMQVKPKNACIKGHNAVCINRSELDGNGLWKEAVPDRPQVTDACKALQ